MPGPQVRLRSDCDEGRAGDMRRDTKSDMLLRKRNETERVILPEAPGIFRCLLLGPLRRNGYRSESEVRWYMN